MVCIYVRFSLIIYVFYCREQDEGSLPTLTVIYISSFSGVVVRGLDIGVLSMSLGETAEIKVLICQLKLLL